MRRTTPRCGPLLAAPRGPCLWRAWAAARSAQARERPRLWTQRPDSSAALEARAAGTEAVCTQAAT